MAYLRDIRCSGELIGRLCTDGARIWAEVDAVAPQPFQGLMGIRYPNQHEAEKALAAATEIAERMSREAVPEPASAEPAAEPEPAPVVEEPVHAKTRTKRSHHHKPVAPDA